MLPFVGLAPPRLGDHPGAGVQLLVVAYSVSKGCDLKVPSLTCAPKPKGLFQFTVGHLQTRLGKTNSDLGKRIYKEEYLQITHYLIKKNGEW